MHYESGIFSLHISDISTYKKYQRKKRYISFPASIAKSAHFIAKKIILHSLFSFCSISFGRLSYIIFKTFITFSESTCCTDRQVMKNITQNTAPCFIQHWLFLAGGVLMLDVTIVSAFRKMQSGKQTSCCMVSNHKQDVSLVTYSKCQLCLDKQLHIQVAQLISMEVLAHLNWVVFE